MEHILFLNLQYPLEPLCRALRAGGVVSTVTESWQEWRHLAAIRPWSLCVVAAFDLTELPESPLVLPEQTYLLLQERGKQPIPQSFSGVWVDDITASTILRTARSGACYVSEPSGEVATGSLLLSPSDHSVWWSGKALDLTPRQFSILRLLAGQPGRVFSRLEVWEHCWGLIDYPESNAIDAHIRRIRRRVPAELSNCIEAVYGVGYRFLTHGSQITHLQSERLIVAY